MKHRAFTVIELLSVVATLSILTSLVLPALSRGKGLARSIWCTSNLRQLQIAWQMYCDENNDNLPLNWDGSPPGSWVVGFANADMTTSNIQQGTLYKYLPSTDVYRCPADKSTVKDKKGGLPRTRHYAMSGYMNCDIRSRPVMQRESVFRKTSDMRKPSSSDAFVFIHSTPQTTGDGEFNMTTTPWLWGGYPFSHGKGQNWSFADGHAVRRRWLEEETEIGSKAEFSFGTSYASTGNRDYIALQEATPFWWIINSKDQQP